jgi:hypothetical protein
VPFSMVVVQNSRLCISLSSTDRHIYTLFISADGNYRLQRKAKNSDEDDVALNNGRGCFVETENYNEYLGNANECDTVSPLISSLLGHLRNVSRVALVHICVLYASKTSSSSRMRSSVGLYPFNVLVMGFISLKGQQTLSGVNRMFQ